MKKVYSLIFMMLAFLITTGQEFNKKNLPYASYREGVELNPLKSAKAPGTFTQKAMVAQTECMIDALLITAESDENLITDVQTYLMNTGKFNVVDTENNTTPTLATLRNYDAVLVWADGSLNDTVGDTLAAYIDEGGGVVSAVFNLFESWGITGTRFNTEYLLLNLGDYTYSGTTTLGTVYDAGHPIMDGVTSLTNPNEFRSNNATMTAGSEVIAEWSDGLPLVVVKENLGPGNARRADINIFPPSSTIRSDFWDASTDGDILLANALLWVSQTCDCPDVVVNNDPGTCGAIVNYTVPTANGAIVTQIDASGLSSGDEFAVGSTIQQFEFDFGGGDLDTCTFNVIVNDTEPPVFTCPEDITVNAASGETCVEVNFPVLNTDISEGEPGIILTDAPTNQAGVAYNPDKKLYYAVRAGSPNYTLYTYDETGTQVSANTAGFDFRGLWWNPNTSSLEGSGYAGNGYRIIDLDTNGYALSTGTNNPVSNYQPNSQSQADYDYDLDLVIFYNNNTIYRTSRTTGDLISSIPITGLPSTTLNNTFVGYTGIPGKEVVIYNPAEKAVYFVDKTTGIYAGLVQLPVTAPGQGTLNTSYANGFIWITDGTLWHSYRIAPVGDGASDNCGAVTATYSHPSGSCFPVGTTEVTLTVTDAAGNSSSCTFNVTVVSGNEDPTIDAIADVTVTDSDSPVMVELTGISDGDELAEQTVTVTAGHDNPVLISSIEVNYTSGETGSLEITLVPGELGEALVTVTVEDSEGGSVSETFTLTVVSAAGGVPVVKANPIEVYLDETGRYELTREDLEEMADGTTDESTPFEELDLSAYPRIYTCEQLRDGIIHARLTVEDAEGNIARAWTTVTVLDTFPPAFVPVENLEIVLEPGLTESGIEYPAIEVLDNCPAEPVLIEGLGQEGTFPVGKTTETWVVEDDGGNTDTLSFTVTVIATNDAPAIDTIADLTANEDDPPVSVELTGISYGNDMDEQTVTVTAESDNMDLVSSLTVNYTSGSTGLLEIELVPDTYGAALITVTVEDSEGESITESFTLTVVPVNDAPFVVNPIGDQAVNASYVLSIPVSAVLGELFDDIDGDELSISAMLENGDPLPAWAEMVDDSLVFNPMIEDTGCVNIVVVATDPDGATATDTFQICVDGYPVSAGQIAAGEFTVNMYPNPARDAVHLKLKTSDFGRVDVSVFTITGKQVLRKNFSNNQRITLNMAEQVSGMYFVKIQMNDKTAVKKLVLDRK